MLFEKEIYNWKSWGEVFQDKEAFSPLAMDILQSEGLPALPLENLSPGTNAVFRSGDVVLKIYVPAESGYDSLPDWLNEIAVMKRAMELGVSAPKLLASGEKQDRYLFRYIVMDHCPGEEAGDAFAKMSSDEKTVFAGKIRETLCLLNRPVCGIAAKDLKKQAAENERFDCLHPHLVQEIKQHAASLSLDEEYVLVHGDCTGENVLVNNTAPMLIDFADCTLAPAWYEYPAAVFELFRCDPDAVRAFRGETDEETFLKRLVDGLCIHQFGGFILHDFFLREGYALDEVFSLRQLEALLRRRLFGIGRLPELFPKTVFPDFTGDFVTDGPLDGAAAFYLANNRARTLDHVREVAETAAELAVHFGADPEKCRTAAIFHDIAVILPREKMLQTVKDLGMELDPAEEQIPMLLHQRFGAMIARELFGITDADVLSAIKYHTTLKEDPSDIDMIVFLADKIRWDRGTVPPFLPVIENGLEVSLKAACLDYLDYIVHHGMVIQAHTRLTEAHTQLRRDRAKGTI